MSAAGDRESRVLVIAPAWQELEAIAAAMRPDWKPQDVQDVRIAAEAAWPFERAAREMWRLIWAVDGTPVELRNTIRAERPRPAGGHLDPGVKAAAVARTAEATRQFNAREGRASPAGDTR